MVNLWLFFYPVCGKTKKKIKQSFVFFFFFKNKQGVSARKLQLDEKCIFVWTEVLAVRRKLPNPRDY